MSVTGIPAQGFNSLSPDQWAEVIVASLGTAVDAILGVGRALLQVRAELPHGDWQRLFQGHPHAVAHPVPFTIRKAQMFIKITEHPILTNAKHVSRLPSSWGTLCGLSEEDLVTVRECSRDECAGMYWDGAEGRNCLECNRPFSRVIMHEGCPDCLEEDSVEPAPVALEPGA